MKSIIICEGETDFVFLQHFMKKVNGWTDSKQKPNPSFISSVDNSRSRDFIKNADMLTIISCGGCGNIKTVFEEVIRKNQNEIFDEERYSKIVILTDNDETGIEAKIVSELNAASGNSAQIQNNSWTDLSFTDATQNQFNSELLLLVIPFDENGALETFLLSSIAKQDEYESQIIKKSYDFVEHADPEKRHIDARSFKIKAVFYAYFAICIEPSKKQFSQRDAIFKSVPWEQYENIRDCFKELRNL